jgi:hypothetical protein
MEEEVEEEKSETEGLSRVRFIGIVPIAIWFVGMLVNHFFHNQFLKDNVISFVGILMLVLGLLLLFSPNIASFSEYFFDNQDYEKSKNLDALLKKIRYRALLFNNIAVAIFIFIIIIILTGFYILINPPMGNSTAQSIAVDSVTVRVGATVLLIFLVQVLFRVFKYLIRISAFYNGISDSIEYSRMKEFKDFDPKLDFLKLMELLTPEKYDISDVQQPSLIDLAKSKGGK